MEVQAAAGKTIKLGSPLDVEQIFHDQAAIRFLADGSVQIQPAPGKSINLAGNLEVGQIHYQPTDTFNQPSGPKRWLG